VNEEDPDACQVTNAPAVALEQLLRKRVGQRVTRSHTALRDQRVHDAGLLGVGHTALDPRHARIAGRLGHGVLPDERSIDEARTLKREED